MDNDIFPDMEELVEQAKCIDDAYKETFDEMSKMKKTKFRADVCIKAMTTYRTEQLAHMIGSDLSDYDKKILAGVVERHIAGVIFKG